MPEIPIRRRSPDEARKRLLAVGFPPDLADEMIAPDEGRLLERQRMVADAIILERAARVIERRHNGIGMRDVTRFLETQAARLRASAGQGAGRE